MSAERLLTTGYAVMDHIDGETHYGGAAAGMAINGVRNGIDTGLLAVFGKEPQSAQYWSYLVSQGVDMTSSIIHDRYRIPESHMSHQNRILGWNDFGVTDVFSDVAPEETKISRFKFLHMASPHYQLAKSTMQCADLSKHVISYSPGPKLRLHPAEYLAPELLGSASMAFFNEEEWEVAQEYLNLSDMHDLIGIGVEICVVTKGRQGASVAYKSPTGSRYFQIKPGRALNVEDTTGAGDAFALGFLIGTMADCLPEESAQIGAGLAEKAIVKKGVII